MPTRVVSHFARGLSQVQSIVDVLLAKIAHDIEAWAKHNAPVDTGFLKGSIRATQESPVSWMVMVGAEYGAYVELGTVKMAAQPYMLPAVEAVRSLLGGGDIHITVAG